MHWVGYIAVFFMQTFFMFVIFAFPSKIDSLILVFLAFIAEIGFLMLFLRSERNAEFYNALGPVAIVTISLTIGLLFQALALILHKFRPYDEDIYLIWVAGMIAIISTSAYLYFWR